MTDFIIVGNTNAGTYMDIFPLIKDDKVRWGYNKVTDFKTGAGEIKGVYATWFSTFPVIRKPLVFTATYSPDRYPVYDNYDAIEVSKVCDIPMDYDGIMGVPDTFLDKYCPEQFEILGKSGLIDYAENECEFFVRPSEESAKKYKSQDKTWRAQNTYIVENGVAKTTYSRIFIRKRTEKENNETDIK